MDTLRTSFGRLNKPQASGAAPKKLSARNKWIIKHLSFLKPYMKHRESTSNLEDYDDNVSVQGGDDDDDEDSHNVTIGIIDSPDDDQVNKSQGLPDLPTLPSSPVRPNTPQDTVEVITSDSDVGSHKGINDSVRSTRRPLPKRPAVCPGPPKKMSKAKDRKINKSDINEESANFFKAVSSTIENLTSTIMERPTPKQSYDKDEVKSFVDSLETKIRSVKKRASRLRLIDAIERLAFKFIMDDCLESEATSAPQQTGSQTSNDTSRKVQYYPQNVHPISPARPVYPVSYENTQYSVRQYGHFDNTTNSCAEAQYCVSQYTPGTASQATTPSARIVNEGEEITTLTLITTDVASTISGDILSEAAKEITGGLNLSDGLP